MDNQKQIEEIKELASVLSKSVIQDYGGVYFLETAEELYEKRVRIIPENAVVLTREEAELFDAVKKGFPIDTSCLAEKYSEIGQTARNRTAKNFAERLKGLFPINEDIFRFSTPEQIQKAVDEICKEITEGKA